MKDFMEQYCPICRLGNVSKMNTPLAGAGQFLTLSVCDDCGYASRAESRDMESNLAMQVDFFDTHVTFPKRKDTRWPHRLALVAAEVKRLAGNKGKVLDIGCNTGVWLAALGSGWEKHGAEISPVAAGIAREFAKAEVYCGPFESYQAMQCSYDLITAFALIEHVSDPRTLVNWAHVHLRPGGYLVLMTGDRESEVAKKMGAQWPLYVPPEHVSFFSARSLCRLVEEAGFAIRRREWRGMMYESKGVGSFIRCRFLNIKEILGMVTKPEHDTFYLYAQKNPGEN